MILLLDAANTIIYKPTFYSRFTQVLERHKISIDRRDFQKTHKIISECFNFPDRTNKEFYMNFNRELLYGLGVIGSIELLEEIFSECSYLKWEKFDDTDYITKINCQKSILSNFNNGLDKIINELFNNEFSSLIISEKENVRKPDIAFFERAVSQLGVNPADIIYVGDSIKLDLEPALKVGMNAWLIDRENYYPGCNRRIESLYDLKNII
ncbi:MAG: HAD family hydrolase [Bacteroidota bacterium]